MSALHLAILALTGWLFGSVVGAWPFARAVHDLTPTERAWVNPRLQR